MYVLFQDGKYYCYPLKRNTQETIWLLWHSENYISKKLESRTKNIPEDITWFHRYLNSPVRSKIRNLISGLVENKLNFE